MRDSELVVDLGALRQNYQFLKSLLQSNGFFCPMVKADAYGMGSSQVVETLFNKESCKSFGVALIKEGVHLRQSVKGDYQILVFSNFKSTDLELYLKYNLTPIVSCFEELRALVDFCWKNAFHIKYNTGINRLSDLKLQDTEEIFKTLSSHSFLKPQAVCSHMSHAEWALSEKSSRYEQSYAEFDEIKKLWTRFNPDVFFHFYNSAGLIAEAQKANANLQTGARVGLSLYGVSPDFLNSSITEYAHKKLKPIFQCRAQVIRTHKLKAGEGISYGWSWVAAKSTRVAVVPLGYADGLKRALSNQYGVYVDGQWAPLIGTICMDYCMVDITGLSPKVGIGSDVLFFSPDKLKILSIKKMAQSSHSIPYEIMTGWGGRLQRTYIGEA